MKSLTSWLLLCTWPRLLCADSTDSAKAVRFGHRHRAGFSSATATAAWAEGLLTDRDRRRVAALNQREGEVGQQNSYDRLQVNHHVFIFRYAVMCAGSYLLD